VDTGAEPLAGYFASGLTGDAGPDAVRRPPRTIRVLPEEFV